MKKLIPESTEKSLLLRYCDVQKMTNLSRSTIHRLAKEGKFPASFTIGSRAVAFDREEVEEWIEERKRARRGTRQ